MLATMTEAVRSQAHHIHPNLKAERQSTSPPLLILPDAPCSFPPIAPHPPLFPSKPSLPSPCPQLSIR